MSVAPRCVMAGLDGFDLDVRVNLACFYQCCGFQVNVANRIPPSADLVVIERGPFQPGTFFDGVFEQCHIYDYVGHGTGDWRGSFPKAREVVVISASGSASTDEVRSSHPVVPTLWLRHANGTRRRIRLVHVGHRKPGMADDPWQAQLDALDRSGQCVCFGDGWSRGPVSLHASQAIYRDSSFALGIQYPFQRGKTTSSRMWLGPLNGCQVFSEAMPAGVDLPGVRKVDRYSEALETDPRDVNASAIVDAAVSYWNDSNVRLAQSLGLRYRPPSRLAARRVYLQFVYRAHLRRAWDYLET